MKVVIFDQGGVLSLGGGRGTNEKFAAQAMGLAKIEVDDLLENLKLGRMSNAAFVDEVNLRYPNAPRALTNGMWDNVYKSLKAEPLAYAFAQKCRDVGLKVGLLSNINEGMVKRFRADGSYKGFNPLVLSCEVGCAKPEPTIYALVEGSLCGIKPQEILLLDDQDKCVLGARKRGWKALKVTNPAQMVREASKLLRLN